MTSSEIEFDPVLTWDLPYHPDLIVWSAQHISKGESTHVDVLPVESLALSAAQKCHRCLIVEGPKDTWGAWQIKNERAVVAVSVPVINQDTDRVIADAVKEQKERLGLKFDAVNVAKVPACCNSSNSAVAALCNLKWLMLSKKRAHPGPLEYIKQREQDYNAYNLEKHNTNS